MRWWLGVAILLLLPPATAQTVSLTAEPIDGTTPLDVLLVAHADPATNATWWIFHATGDNVHRVANGTGLPAEATIRLDAIGTYELRLVANLTTGVRVATTTVIVKAPLNEGVVVQPAVAGDILPLAFAGVLMLGLAVWLLARDFRNRLNIAFGLLFIARGIADLTQALFVNTGTLRIDASVMERLHPVSNIGVVAAAVYFLLVYLAQNNARLATRRVVGPATLAAAAFLSALVLWQPALYWGRPGAVGGILFAVTGLYYPLYTVIVYLLVRESRKDIPDDRRDGAFYSALGFLFLPAFVGVGEFAFVDVMGYLRDLQTGTGVGFSIGHWAAVLAVVPLMMASAIMARAALHEGERLHTRLHATLFVGGLAVAVGSLAVPILAYQGGGTLALRAHEAASAFWIFQGIWAIPYAVLVAWGITRYQESSRQHHMRRQLRRLGLASIFFTIFFAVSEGLEALVSSAWGTEIGLGTAAGLTLVLGPLQERIQKRFLQADPEEETAQEVRFYEAQLRRTAQDGVIGEHERRFLTNLRETMGISSETALRIEQRVLARPDAL